MDARTIPINEVTSLSDMQIRLSLSDIFSIVRLNNLNIGLSYKTNFTYLSNFYLLNSTIEHSTNALTDMMNEVDLLSTKYVLKENIDESLSKKEYLEGKVPGFLTRTQMDSTISKYATKNDIEEKNGSAKEYAYKLNEEMTDLIAAAIIGINQMATPEVSAKLEE